MKSKFEIAGSPYTKSRLGVEDAEALRDFYVGLKEPFFMSGFVGLGSGHDVTAWQYVLKFPTRHENDRSFALWEGDKMIGATGVSFKKVNGTDVAVFTGSQIADAYLKRGLSQHLYDMRFDYLKEISFKGRVEAYIKPENIPSKAAAKTAGLIDTGKPYPGSPDHNIWIYAGDRLPGVKVAPEMLDARHS